MNEKIYLISYEVNEAQFDYSDLKETIKAHFHSAHDHVFVMQVEDGIPRQGWLPKSFWKWLKNSKEI